MEELLSTKVARAGADTFVVVLQFSQIMKRPYLMRDELAKIEK